MNRKYLVTIILIVVFQIINAYDNEHHGDNMQVVKSVYTTLENFNFKNGLDESGFGIEKIDGEWGYFEFGNFVADQAILSKKSQKVNGGGYLRIDSNPFSKTTFSNLLDHLKFLIVSKNTYQIPDQGSLVIRFKARAETFNTDKHPFGELVSDHNSDYRLAMGVLNVFDLRSTMIVADFFITNGKIYILYERLPFARSESNIYASFAYAIPVETRKEVGEFHKLSISFSKNKKQITWFVDGKAVFYVNKVGHHLPLQKKYLFIDKGGVEELVFPDNVAIGLGTMTVLDGTFPETSPQLGLVRESEIVNDYLNPMNQSEIGKFFDESSLESNRIFGQGCNLDVKDIKIQIKS